MDADARRVLEMMLQEKAIGSKKLNTLTEMMMSDGRLRGSTMYYGAPATGRWSGRGPQPQNLPRPPKLYTTNTDALYEIIMRRDVPGLVAVVEAENEARKAKKLVDRLLLVDLLAAMLRGCLCARDGYVFVMADYNAIEARCVAWMANDEAAVQAFQAADRGVGADPYCIMAGRIYNRLVTKKDETERQVGKVVELGCGYGLGWKRLGDYAKLQGVDMVGMGLDPLYVNEQYRDAHSAICGRKVKDAVYSLKPDECRPAVRKGGLWKELEAACRSAINGRPAESHGIRYEKVGDHVYCTLHSGRKLLYRNMGIVEMVDQWGRMRPAIVYDKPRVKKHEDDDEDSDDVVMDAVRATTWGGKLVENCTGRNTLVLTQRGWVPITDVRITDLVWDGIEWVSQGGVLYQGKRRVMVLYGVSITPDHKIWTKRGWEHAAIAAITARRNWVEVQQPDRPSVRKETREAHDVGNAVRLWESVSVAKREDRCKQVLRLFERASRIQSAADARYDEASYVSSVAFDETAMYRSNSCAVAELWGPGDNGVFSVARIVPEFPRGYGRNVPTRAFFGSDRQQFRVLQRELSMGYVGGAMQQYALECCSDRPDRREIYNGSVGGTDRFKSEWYEETSEVGACVGSIDHPTPHQQTDTEEDVFDLANCGPRHRFTVLTDNGPLLVHNCVQADCRDLLADAMVRVQYIRDHTVLHVHDEIVLEVPEAEADAALKHLVIGMTGSPILKGMPLKAEAVKSKVYGKGKAILTAVDGEIR